MNVTKRDGSTEAVDLNKILKSLQRATNNLSDVDPMIIAQATIASLQNNIQTKQIDEIAINLCAGKIAEEPNYGYVAARLLAQTISKEAGRDNTLWQVTEALFNTDQVTKQYRKFVKKHKIDLEKILDHDRDDNFTFFGLSVIKDRYLLKDKSGRILERPQHLWMRVAIALSETIQEVKEAYDAISKFYYMPSTPTLFNAGTPHPQMSSCYLMDVQEDSISGIYQTYADAAQLSKWAGGLGISWDEVRATGSFINGTKGRSTGLIPFLKTLDSSVKAVNQAGKRRGSAAVYLSTWHADIEHFLELRDNTGLEAERTYNLNLANWIPDLFMERVDNDQDWSLFCPSDVPELKYTWGEKFNQVYLSAEQAGLARKTIKARELYKRMMTTLAETGNGWMNFKDLVNRNHPQVEISGIPVTSSNLCVAGDTWTLTENGPKQVKDLVGSKQRLVVNGKVEETTDKGFWKTGTLETFEIRTKSGYKVKGTANHKFLTSNNNWVELKDLKPGDKLSLSNHKSNSWTGTGGTFEEGWLVGSWIGDGTSANGSAMLDYWGEHKEFFRKQALEFLELSGLKKRTISGHDIPRDDKVRITSKPLFELITKTYNISPSYKVISSEVEQASSDFNRGLIQGLLDADGTVLGRSDIHAGISARLASINLELLEGVQRILSRLGITSTIYKDRRKTEYRSMPNGKGGHAMYLCQPLHELVISRTSVALFNQIIGFSDPGKSSKLATLISGLNKSIYRSKYEAQIQEIALVGTEDVYDCTVPTVSEFDANGFRAHNCTEILEVRDYKSGEVSVCNLGSLVLSKFVDNSKGYLELHEGLLRETVRTAIRLLDRVIDRNFYPLDGAAKQNNKWRNIGLGVMGWHDTLMKLKIDIESQEARMLNKQIFSIIWDEAVKASEALAVVDGPFPAFKPTSVMPNPRRNSLLIAIAPTACQLGTNRIQTSEGIKSLYEILEESGVDYKSIENSNTQQWVDLKPITVPTLKGNQNSSKIWYNGKQPVFDITFEDGATYTYTANHQLLVTRNNNQIWVRVDELQEGDDVVQVSSHG